MSYCLGVKNAFWNAGPPGDFKELLQKMEQTQTMVAISPACLVKIVEGAVEYARSFGFPPHPDYRHAALLLSGIDPKACTHEFTFGRDGKPFYIQGPNESPAMASCHHATNPGGRGTLPHRGDQRSIRTSLAELEDGMSNSTPWKRKTSLTDRPERNATSRSVTENVTVSLAAGRERRTGPVDPRSGKSLTDRAQDDARHNFVEVEPPGKPVVC